MLRPVSSGSVLFRNLLLITGALYWIALPAWGSTESSISVIRGVHYDADQTMDVYVPLASSPYPRVAMLLIHGGCFTAGCKEDLEAEATYFASQGVVAFSVSYRLAPRFRYPTQVMDVASALNFVRTRSREYWIDPGRVVALGYSAGGFLAAHLGVLTGKEISPVALAISIAGRMDLSAPPSPGGEDCAALLMGIPRVAHLDRYRSASPLFRVGPTAAPFLLFHGAKDAQVDPVHSTWMFEALERVRPGQSRLVIEQNEGHGFGEAAIQRLRERVMLEIRSRFW